MRNNWEVITTTDKEKRDAMYDDLKKNGNELEKQVVKFSDYELVDDVYRSTWSLAYPRSDV